MKIPTLETQRLRLRAFRNDDFDPYARFMADPEVTKFLGGPMARGDAFRSFTAMIGHWELRGFGPWAVERKSDGAFIGRIGLSFPEDWPATEVVWTLAREYWGHGYATEAARSSLDYGFRKLPLPRLVSMIDPDNRGSQRVAERLGQIKKSRETLTVFGKSYPVDLWEITRERWSN